MSSPVTNSSRLLKKINLMASRPPRAFRVAILGQNGVGKTAFAVRFITRRYIGEYDPFLERIYTCQRPVLGSTVEFEVLDTAGLNENSKLKEHIRWADAIILMYDVTDHCSFNECSRLKFLVNAHSRSGRRRKTGSDPNTEPAANGTAPVALVGNKKDRDHDRMVSAEEGAERARQLSCVSFQEVSVQEDLEEVTEVFEDLYQTYGKIRKSRSSLAGSLTASKTSLFGGDSSNSSRLQGSSSDDDSGGNNNNNNNSNSSNKNGNNNNRGLDGNGNISSGRGGDGEGTRDVVRTPGRRVTLSNTTADLPGEEWIRKARSRRREAFHTIN